ncbi:MAG: LuxR C-terminal-related transcriptional regulator, partial [Candidatus Dormibacteria bacterium]
VLAAGDLGTALQVAQQSDHVDMAERQLVIGMCHAMFRQAESAETALREAFNRFRLDRPPRAAAAAVFLGRMHYFLHDSPRMANGWFARARRLVSDRPDCYEHALASLPLPGCDMTDVTELRRSAADAVVLARRLGDRNLEAKALADQGTAEISLALVDEGMTLLDEAMAMVLSGEADSPFARAEVVCNLFSSCGRVGDIRRADEWTRAAERHLGLGFEQGSAFLYAHCRSVFGLILCDVGRWDEAEAALRLAATRAPQGSPRTEGQVRAALAELWLLRGCLDDAERLLTERREHVETLLPLAGLHLARGQFAEATAVARQGLRMLGEDRVRAARLLTICVDAELARGRTESAEAAADELDALTRDRRVPVLAARAGWARGRIAEARDQPEMAVDAYEAGLRALPGTEWPLLSADLHLALARVLAAGDAGAAIAEARVAHNLYELLGSPRAERSAELLNRLGMPVRVPPRRADATASLSPRELVVLELLRDGCSNADIAARLHNSVRTIEHHVSSVLGKLGLRSRAEAAAYAASRAIVAPPSATPSRVS